MSGLVLASRILVEIIRDRRDVALLDPGFIHERVIDGADLAQSVAGEAPDFAASLMMAKNLVLGLVTERVERAEARLVRRDHRPGIPRPVGIVEEAVAGLGLRINASQIKAPGADLGTAADCAADWLTRAAPIASAMTSAT